MKKFVILLIVLLPLASCKQNNSKKENKIINYEGSERGLAIYEDKKETGNFTVDGFSYSGKSSTQFLGDKEKDQFVVICQADEPYILLQATITNRESAVGSLMPAENFYTMKAGEAHIALSGIKVGNQEFATKDQSTGDIIVNGNKLLLKKLKLFNLNGDSKIISAEITF